VADIGPLFPVISEEFKKISFVTLPLEKVYNLNINS
jgi:hypothetical protein